MLSRKRYLIHFARIFFATLLLIICSFISHVWKTYQPFHLAFQMQRCQSNRSNINIWNWLNNFQLIHFLPIVSFFSTINTSKCHSHINDNYPLNIKKFIEILHSLLLMYLIYHLICLSLFHSQRRRIQKNQYYYAQLYRQDQISRCSNRLLKT